MEIVCYDGPYQVQYTSPEDAWPDKLDDCDSPTMSGTPSPRELKALNVAYKKPDMGGLTVLYDMCATAAPKSFNYLKTAGTPPQLREVRGMLTLCPKHPLRSVIEGYIGGAKERNKFRDTIEIIVKSTGSSSGSVTYVTPTSDSFNMSQDTSAAFPWYKKWNYNDDLMPGWNMNAQQNGGGQLTCIVKQDGRVIAQNTSSGSYAMVTCQP